MFVFRAVIHKIVVRIANRDDPDQTASSVRSVSTLFVYDFWQTTTDVVFEIL